MKEKVPSLKFREACDDDSSGILDLVFDIWINEYGFEVKREEYPDLHQIQSFYRDKGGQFWVALANDRIIGTVAYDLLNEGEYVLKRMFVEQSFRGMGVAQRLLDEILNQLPCPCSVYLSTKEDQALAAKSFYLKNGFQVISRKDLPNNFPFFYEDDLFMKKEDRSHFKV